LGIFICDVIRSNLQVLLRGTQGDQFGPPPNSLRIGFPFGRLWASGRFGANLPPLGRCNLSLHIGMIPSICCNGFTFRVTQLDRQKYLAAQAMAEKRGTTLQIADDRNAAPAQADTRTHHQTETHLYVTSAAMRDRATYKRLNALAEREHLTFQPVRTLADVEGANNGNA
jgi:hypothetical protein